MLKDYYTHSSHNYQSSEQRSAIHHVTCILLPKVITNDIYTTYTYVVSLRSEGKGTCKRVPMEETSFVWPEDSRVLRCSIVATLINSINNTTDRRHLEYWIETSTSRNITKRFVKTSAAIYRPSVSLRKIENSCYQYHHMLRDEFSDQIFLVKF